MRSKISVTAKRRRLATIFVGIFLDLGALDSLAVKLTGLLGVWLQMAGCTPVCMIQSDALACCYFSTPHCFSGELIAPSKAGVTLAGVPVILRLSEKLRCVLVCAALPDDGLTRCHWCSRLQ